MPRSYGHPVLNQIFAVLTKAGGESLPPSQRTIYCDGQDTLFLHKRIEGVPSKIEPHGNLPLYRLLLKFNEAGAKIALRSDEAMDATHADVKALLAELKTNGLDDSLLRDASGHVRIGSWNYRKKEFCGVVIDNNEGAHHHSAHVYLHPADSDLHDLQAWVQDPGSKMVVPSYMKLGA